jgi:cobalt-zinc-cadmium efflux system outer membrane protein
MLGEAKDVRSITEYSYRRGEATLLEFLDAQRAFNETMQNYNDARTDYARSLYLLDSVSGRTVNP